MTARGAETLTDRQREIFRFIVEFRASAGFSPTFREIGRRFSIDSTNAVSDHVTALIRKGWLRKDPRSARTLVPCEGTS